MTSVQTRYGYGTKIISLTNETLTRDAARQNGRFSRLSTAPLASLDNASHQA